MYCIYLISSPSSVLKYYGVSKHPKRRFKEHSKANTRVGKFIRNHNDAQLSLIEINLTEEKAYLLEETLVPCCSQQRKNQNLLNDCGGGKKPPAMFKNKFASVPRTETFKKNASTIMKELSKQRPDDYYKKCGQTRKENIKSGKIKIWNTKSWTFVDPQGVKTTVYNLKKFCREKHPELNYPSMVEVSQGKRNQHKGWTKN